MTGGFSVCQILERQGEFEGLVIKFPKASTGVCHQVTAESPCHPSEPRSPLRAQVTPQSPGHPAEPRLTLRAPGHP